MVIDFNTLQVGDILRKPTYAVSIYKVVAIHPASTAFGWSHGRRKAVLEAYNDNGTVNAHMGKYSLSTLWEGEGGGYVQLTPDEQEQFRDWFGKPAYSESDPHYYAGLMEGDN